MSQAHFLVLDLSETHSVCVIKCKINYRSFVACFNTATPAFLFFSIFILNNIRFHIWRDVVLFLCSVMITWYFSILTCKCDRL